VVAKAMQWPAGGAGSARVTNANLPVLREIGEAAVAAMLERRAHPTRPARDIFVQCTLVVRQSCGGKAS